MRERTFHPAALLANEAKTVERYFGVGIRAQSSHLPRMNIATIVVRVLLGLVFVVFGSNGFLHFLPMPPLPHNMTGDFLNALFLSHYIYAIALCQVAGGLLLLIGRFVPLGLTILGPVIVNIVLFHIFLAPEGLPLALVIALLFLFLLWRYWSAFAAILRP
jgi:putative oxidoreductase